MVEMADMHQVWFVVSPHNPLKKRQSLAKDQDRLHLVRLATEDNPKLVASNIEFSLPKPSYTIDTLVYIKEKYPNDSFSLIMGSDNLSTLEQWKNYEILLRDYSFLVYRRPGSATSLFDDHPHVRFFDAPLLDISATFIREGLRNGRSMRYLLPDPVYQYLDTSKLYRD